MPTTTITRWAQIARLPDGHRLFFDESSRRVAIADRSGRTPTTTDDGVLFLDTNRPLSVGSTGACLIPVLDEQAGAHYTPTDLATTLHLASEYEWQVLVSNGYYNVKKVRQA